MSWPTREQKILMFDPWSGGKGDDPHRTFSDRFVVTRYPHDCAICLEPIPAGVKVRAQVQINLDGSKQVKTFRFCPTCCNLMAVAWRDGGEAISDRYGLGVSNSRKHRKLR